MTKETITTGSNATHQYLLVMHGSKQFDRNIGKCGKIFPNNITDRLADIKEYYCAVTEN